MQAFAGLYLRERRDDMEPTIGTTTDEYAQVFEEAITDLERLQQLDPGRHLRVVTGLTRWLRSVRFQTHAAENASKEKNAMPVQYSGLHLVK
jgi:hypothetical protein